MTEKQDKQDDGVEIWTPTAGKFGRFISWSILLLIAVVVVWMLFWIFQ